MADQKISALPAYVGNASAGDYLVIVDNTTTPATPTTKRINVGQITPVPVTPYSATLTGSYAIGTSIAFYNPATTSAVNWVFSAVGTTTTLAGTISDGTTTVNITSGTSGSTAPLLLNGCTIGGTATGTGSTGTSATVNLSGSIPAVVRYIPAFYAQTTNNTPPVFTSASSQTAGAAQGSTITYPLPSATTNYCWICTQRPLANLFLVTSFGNVPLVPDVTAPNQTISGQVFQVYGFTNLSLINPVVLQVN